MNNNYIKWKKDSATYEDKGFFVRDLLVKNSVEKGFNEIIDRYVYIYPEQIKRTFQLIPGAWGSFFGSGIDLGGGVGCISSTIAQKQNVKDIYCVEFAENVVRLCHPIIKKTILSNRVDKVVSVVGDFNNLELPDSSLDFAVTWDSIHHSQDPVKTLKECKRVLKKGGKLVIIDRAHNNNIPDSEIDRMLNVVYGKDFLKRSFLDENIIIKRKELGEHEWRFFELEDFFRKSGFNLIESIVIKTDTKENRQLKNDNNLVEIFTNYNLGGFLHRKVGFVLEA